MEEIEIRGKIDQAKYRNADSTFCVVKLLQDDAKRSITVVGPLITTSIGAQILVVGQWVFHEKYKRQFKASYSELLKAKTPRQIEIYLKTAIAGIGPTIAEAIVQNFGIETLDILDHNIERIKEVPGISGVRYERISQSWEERRMLRPVVLFLQEYDLPITLAPKILRRLGKSFLLTVKNNPYCLSEAIDGIGFNTADQVARKMNFSVSHPCRLQAGITHVLNKAAQESGHLYYPRTSLISSAEGLLGVDRTLIEAQLEYMKNDHGVIVERTSAEPIVYLKKYHAVENAIVGEIKRIKNGTVSLIIDKIDLARWMLEIARKMSLPLDDNQQSVVRQTMGRKVSAITGGPGTGKSTLIRALQMLLIAAGARVLLAAPTGRAARRISEICKCPAHTIHRMLEYFPPENRFRRDAGNPLECDALILDECSMIDSFLMRDLLDATPSGCIIIFVGDAQQLPPVGPGSPFQQIIVCGVIPVFQLTTIYRQSQMSQIVVNAHRMQNGEPFEAIPAGQESDFYFHEQDNSLEAVIDIVELVKNRIPEKFQFDPISDIQVLTPMYAGPAGVDNLNNELQKALNPSDKVLPVGKRIFKQGDKIVQCKNNYDKQVFNGDIGRILRLDQESARILVQFDDVQVVYERGDLDQLALAYAMTIHKSQGSQFPAVVMALLPETDVMLRRNLLYTGITRGQKLTTVIGTEYNVRRAIANNDTDVRFTRLAARLREKL
jgi:exodeoxyribonuclease V alpha subunit